MALTGDLRIHTHGYLLLYAGAAAGYLLAASGLRSLPVGVIVGTGLVLRLLLFPGEPTLSDDYHRYIWDGLVQVEGVNPYLYPPDDPALDAVDYPDRHLINHPSQRTLYPPLSELLFAGLARIGAASAAGLKTVFGLFDLATAALIGLAAGRRRVEALGLYLLHPLLVQETWSSAHLDAAPVLLIVAAVLLLTHARDLAAGMALGLGAAFKFYPGFLLVPALLGRRARPLPLLAGFAAGFGLPYLPYALTGAALGSITETGSTPEFDSSAFYLIRLVLPYGAARTVAIVGFLAAAVVLARRLPGRPRTALVFAWTSTLMVLFLPVVHPWYWLAPVALGALAGVRLPLFLGLAAPASYVTYAQAPFRQRLWARLLSYSALATLRAGLKAPATNPDIPKIQSGDLPGSGGPALAIMARAAVPGRVKTRLAARIGNQEAAAVYHILLADTMARAAVAGEVALYLAVEPAGATIDVTEPDGRGGSWAIVEQRGDGLGSRLAAVFADLFAAGHDPVVVVGSDSPALPPAFLRKAFHLLRADGPDEAFAPPPDARPPVDMAVGPAFDGGYYLIGLSHAAWERCGGDITLLLRDSPMGTPDVAEYTRAGARNLGLRVAELPLWIDVDEPRDLTQAAGILPELGRSVSAAAKTPSVFRAAPSAAAKTPAASRVALSAAAETPVARAAPYPSRTHGRLREVYLHVTHRCGTGCPQCYLRDARDPDSDRSGELDTEDWKSIVDQAVALGATGFVIIGGDPFLRPDLTAVIDHITGVHGAKVRLFFNRAVSPETAAELARVGRDRLTPLLSIDGAEAVNDSLRGAGNFADARDSIRALLAAELRPVVNTVLLRPVLPTLPDLARELARDGVLAMHLILPHQRGGLADRADMVPSGDELLAAIRALESTATEVGVAVDNLAAWKARLRAPRDLCGAGCDLLAVDPEGLVHACPITCGDDGFVAGDLRKETLAEVWRRSPSLELLRATHARDREECRSCPVVDACGGECWVQAHYAARARGKRAGYLAPFPYCDLVRPVLKNMGAARPEGDGDRDPVDLTPFDCI